MNVYALLVLLGGAIYGYCLFKPEDQYPVFAAGMGLALAIFTWRERGPRFKSRWFLCAWGTTEFVEVFVCQGAQLWWVIEGPQGMCSAYTGLPLFSWGTVWFAVLIYRLAKDIPRG